MIIDAHAHVSDSDYGNVDLLIQQLDDAGIDHAIVVPGGMIDVRKMTLYITGEEEPRQEIPNNVVFDAIAKYPNRLKGFVCLNPLEDDDALATFEEAIARGCIGVKLSPMCHQFAFGGDVLEEIATRCAERNMPIYSHTLFNPGASTDRFAQFAKEFKNTNFIIGHMGFGPADVHAMDFALKMDNFFMETSLANYLTLKIALEKLGASKLIFGSEFPMSLPRIQLENIRALGSDEIDKILYKNIMSITNWNVATCLKN